MKKIVFIIPLYNAQDHIKELANSLLEQNNKNWEDYCKNFLSYTGVLNPVGILRGFNTRTYEVLYSGRFLLQQTYGRYSNHENLIAGHSNVILFETFDERLLFKFQDLFKTLIFIV